MFVLEEINNRELRKSYKCNENTDYYNRAGHDCYSDDSSMITTILIGLAVIVLGYLLLYRVPKRIKKHIKEKKEQKETEEDSKEKTNKKKK